MTGLAVKDRRSLLFPLIAIAAIVGVMASGQFATFPNLSPWYAGLTKPFFNPPNWLFGPVWTTLYVLMAVACWRIARLPSETAGRGTALGLFFLQLALNAAWSWMFFAAHSPLLGLVNIIPQWLAIVATIRAFARLDRVAGLLMLPLAAWVTFAAALNAALLYLNP